ncbi:MAG: MFS transporter [Acidimicrobiia bacterium]
MDDDQPASPGAPFIPSDPDAPPVPSAMWRVFGTQSFFHLWLAQVISSLGDWIGLIAILAIAARVSNNSGAAVSLVMLTRVLPGFLLGTLGGVIIDRFDRRKVMVLCDIGRASLLVLLPFVENILGLVLISLGLELMTLLWGPAQAATVPHFVPEEHLASANSLSLAASYGTFPIASIIFSLLAGTATVLGRLDIISAFQVDQEVLALVFDAMTFLVSAAIIWRLPFPQRSRAEGRRIDWPDTFRDIKEGLQFIGHNPLVRGVIIGLGFGLIGAGAMIPLGPAFATEVLSGGSAAFGVLMTALGFGAAFGVVTFLWLQGRMPRSTVFAAAVVGTGTFLIMAASVSSLAPAALFIGGVGACAGTSYVTGFTVLQENVGDDLRGRIFATLYTVIRLCLLISLTISPLWSDFWDWVTSALFDNQKIELGPYGYALPGVRIALWGGGIITLVAGLFAWRSISRAQREDPEQEERAAQALRAEADADVARVRAAEEEGHHHSPDGQVSADDPDVPSPRDASTADGDAPPPRIAEASPGNDSTPFPADDSATDEHEATG